MLHKLYGVCPVVLLLVSMFTFPAVAKDEMVFALDRYVRKAVQQGIPGASLAVVVHGKVRLLRGYGVTRIGGKQRINSATVFPLASVSKTFTSTVAAILISRGLIEWDTHVVPYLEHVTFSDPELGKHVTLRHLLSHSSGLVPHAYTDLLEDNVRYARILQMLSRVRFVCEPGRCYGYQNVMYNLGADMLALASGKDYATLVKELIFVPLEMSHASFGLTGYLNSPNRVEPHVKVKSGFAAVKPAAYYYQVPAAAGVNASAQDLAKWMLAQFGHQPGVLRPSVLAVMHKPHVRANQYRYRAQLSNVYYALGWRTFDYQGIAGFVHHGGWVRGIRTEMVFNPTSQTGMVFLTNCETNVAREIVIKFLDLYKQYIYEK